MTAETPTQANNPIFSAGLNLYRRTIKRIRPLHEATHWLVTHTLIPFLEATKGFHTMPDDPFWFRLELLTNRHERETTQNVKTILKPGMTVLDIGGHVGYYTCLASQLVGDTGRIVTFEPHPRNVVTLRQNVASLKNVTVLQVALADKEGTAELYDYLMMSASGSLHYDEKILEVQRSQMSASDVAPRAKDFQPQKFTVRTARVDDLMAELNIQHVDMVKMDIEGAEMGALRGMQKTIQQSPHLSLFMEYNPLGLQAFGNDPVDALSEVLKMGFSKVYVIESDSRLTDYTHDSAGIRALTHRLVQNMGVVNLLFQRG